MPMVSRGDATYPVLTDGHKAAVAAQGAAHDATKATFIGKEVKPTRISARYVLAVEDMARLEGLEDTLRSDLQMALGVALDNEIINGDGSGAHFTGIIQEFGNVADGDAVAEYATYQAALAAGVDGKYASSMSEVRMAIGTATFTHALAQSQAASGENAYEYLGRVGGGVMVTAQLPAVKSKNQLYIRTSMGSDAVAPVWQGIQLIRDPYTNASSGEVALTAIMLAGFSLLRKDAFNVKKLQIEK